MSENFGKILLYFKKYLHLILEKSVPQLSGEIQVIPTTKYFTRLTNIHAKHFAFHDPGR